MIRGIIRGTSIDLDQGTGPRDGQRVSVVVQPLPDDQSPAGDDQDRLRGVVSIPRARKVLATSNVEICTSQLPRRRPQVVLTQRMLDHWRLDIDNAPPNR
jgi:hypothetical protein